MNTSMKKERMTGVDVVRCIALFLVISMHFCSYSELAYSDLHNKLAYLMVLVRSTAGSCVPLFLMLTGYLMNGKKLSAGYYRGIIHTLIVYVICSSLCVLFKIYWIKWTITPLDYIRGMLDFSNAPYGWYIGMYIHLFMMIPFLNILYHGIQEKKHKRALLLTFLLITAVPAVANTFVFNTPGWWSDPSVSEDYFLLVPQWWTDIFPLTYYFLGCYLREYGWKIRSSVTFLLMILSLVLTGSYWFYRSGSGVLMLGPWTDFQSLLVVLNTVLIFTFFVFLDYSRLDSRFRKTIAALADWCLGGYLLSWIFDFLYIEQIFSRIGETHERLKLYPVIACGCFLCATCLSGLVNTVIRGCGGLFGRLHPGNSES